MRIVQPAEVESQREHIGEMYATVQSGGELLVRRDLDGSVMCSRLAPCRKHLDQRSQARRVLTWRLDRAGVNGLIGPFTRSWCAMPRLMPDRERA